MSWKSVTVILSLNMKKRSSDFVVCSNHAGCHTAKKPRRSAPRQALRRAVLEIAPRVRLLRDATVQNGLHRQS